MTGAVGIGWRRHARIATEVAGLFLALVIADRWLTGATAFAGVEPNPLWVPVVAMALAYGTGLGIVAASLATAYWLWAIPGPSGGDYLDRLLRLSLTPLLWFVSAGVIGEVTLARARRVAWLSRRAAIADRNIGRLGDAIEELGRTNRTLQVRIAAEGATTGFVVATAARLAAANPATRRAAIVELVQQATGTGDFTCYLTAPDGGARAWLRGPTATGRPEALPAALAAIVGKRGGTLHVGRRADRVPLEGMGVAALPLKSEGEMIGVLVLHSLPFEALDVHRRAGLAEVGDWLALLLEEAPRGIPRSGGVGLVA